MNCTDSTNNQTILLACTDESMGCGHLFQESAQDTVVRLPNEVSIIVLFDIFDVRYHILLSVWKRPFCPSCKTLDSRESVSVVGHNLKHDETQWYDPDSPHAANRR